jgi:hypothetical protein
MFEYKNVKPLTNVPLACFKAMGLSRDRDLYELRLGAVRNDGYFLVKLREDESSVSAFTLEGDHAGSYFIGQIQPSPSAVDPNRVYHELFIHGGSRDATAFCKHPSEIMNLLKGLELNGTDSLFGLSEYWEASLDHPFQEKFVEHPQDLRFEMLFGDNSLFGGNSQMDDGDMDDYFGMGGMGSGGIYE